MRIIIINQQFVCIFLRYRFHDLHASSWKYVTRFLSQLKTFLRNSFFNELWSSVRDSSIFWDNKMGYNCPLVPCLKTRAQGQYLWHDFMSHFPDRHLHVFVWSILQYLQHGGEYLPQLCHQRVHGCCIVSHGRISSSTDSVANTSISASAP